MADTFSQFIEDIRPMFYRRSITYVDVGAYDGAMLKALIDKSFNVGEAHLIEPNPESFALLEKCKDEHKKNRSIHIYNAAAGDDDSEVVMKSARKMTAVLSDSTDKLPALASDEGVFQVRSMTLDSLRPLIRDGHISLLKVDVEGYEKHVLSGAESLLRSQEIDVIYIEAGADPNSKQHVHYRVLDEIMNGFGYRLFKIYEQMHEWTGDSPFLRRMNLAYLSAQFAEQNPLKLTRELYALQERDAELKNEIMSRQAEVEELKQALSEARAAVASNPEQHNLEKQKIELDSRIAELESQLQAGGDRHLREAGLEKDLEAARKSLGIWRRRAEAASGAAKKRDAEHSQALAHAQDRLAELQDRLEAAETARSATDQQLRLLSRSHAQANESVAAMAHRLKAALDDQESRESAMAAQLSVASAEREDAERRLRQSEDALVAARSRLETDLAARDAAHAEIEASLKQALADLQRATDAELAARETEQAKTEAELREALGELQMKLDLAESALAFEQSRSEADAEQREQLKTRLHAEIADRDARIGQLSARLEDAAEKARDELGAATSELSAARQSIARLEDELADMARDRPLLMQRETELRAKLAEVEALRSRALLKADQEREKRILVEQELQTLRNDIFGPARRKLARATRGLRGRRIHADNVEQGRPSPLQREQNGKGSDGGAANAFRTARRKLARATRPWRTAVTNWSQEQSLSAPSSETSSSHPSGLGGKAAAKERGTGRDKTKTRASSVDVKLWSGFSGPALRELAGIASDNAARSAERIDASWALSAWDAAEARPQQALDHLIQYRALGGAGLKADLLETYILAHLGRAVEARPRLAARLAASPDDPTLSLAMANTFVSSACSEPIAESATRLDWINRVYRAHGLAPLKRIDESLPIIAGNLVTDTAEDVHDDHKVTVIVPAYNAEDNIDMTLDGLVRQTWRNLEIIVVDDQSPDRTAERVEARAQRDPRIRLLRQPINQGSYSCRNLGLQSASGDFITIHDAGDWSHPQKIERQARHLLSNPHCMGNHSKWVRCYENLLFLGKFRHKDRLIDWNPSSLMFRRSLFDKVGGWDRVRISADAEFFRRAKAAAAPMEIVPIPEVAPLAFGFDTPTSLTKRSTTHGRTITHGFRREYHEAANHWHAVSAPADLKIESNAENRPFPAPGPIQARRLGEVAGDLVVFAPIDSTYVDEKLAARIGAALDSGLKVILFNWRLYESDVAAPTDSRLRQMARERSLVIAAPGETIRAHRAILPCPAVLENSVDLFPGTRIDQVIVVDDGSRSIRADALTAALFGDRGEWLKEDHAWERAIQGPEATADVPPAKPRQRKRQKA